MPHRKWPFGKAEIAVTTTKNAPIAVTMLGVNPILRAKRQAGVINLVTGALNGMRNIVPIVG
ncbi:unannotated protein [freshwater metagenome]|uniref:Unannotated protein n=1 Tax=freshwater metagenome TaxID=449393 RepID=A0A6J7MPR1_9ZZZZ